MNRVDVSPITTSTSYEAARAPSSFQEASRFMEERFSSVPPILEPAYEAFLERFLAEMVLYIEEANRHTPQEQIDLFLFVIQLISCHTAAHQKTLDSIVYAHIKKLLVDSLDPLCNKVATLQEGLETPYFNPSLLDKLKAQNQTLLGYLITNFDRHNLFRIKMTANKFGQAIAFYERAFSIKSHDTSDSAQILAQKHLSDTYFTWVATLFNILKNPNPYSMNALKGPLLEFLTLFFRSSLLHLYQVKSGDTSNTSAPFILSQKIEDLDWRAFFNAIGLIKKPAIQRSSLRSSLVTRLKPKDHSNTKRFYDRQYVTENTSFFLDISHYLFSFYIANYLLYLSKITHSKHKIPSRLILFIARKIDKKNTKVSSISFPLQDKKILAELRTSLDACLSLPYAPFLFVELRNLLDWLEADGFSARHYPFLLHTFHRITDFSILNMLQTCFHPDIENPSPNIQDYFPLLEKCIPGSLLERINDLTMGDALDSFITSSDSKSAQEIVEAIDLSKIYHTPQEHEQIASKFVTQIEPLIRVLTDLITSLQTDAPQKSLSPPSSQKNFTPSPYMIETIYREAISPSVSDQRGELTQEKKLAAIYLNWVITLLTLFETPTTLPPYALDGIFSESLDLFLRFSFLNFYKLTKDPLIDCRNLDALPEALKNHVWEDFFTAVGFPKLQMLDRLTRTYTFITRYWAPPAISLPCLSYIRHKKRISQLMNNDPLPFCSFARQDLQRRMTIYLFSLPTFDFTTIKWIRIRKKSFDSLLEIAKNIEKEHTQGPSIPFNREDKKTLMNLINSLCIFLSLRKCPFLLPELLHLLYWLHQEGFSIRHYPFLLHGFHRIVEYAILDVLQKWFALNSPDPSKNIEDYFPYLRDTLVKPDLADRIGALILEDDLDYFIHPEARTGAKEIMEAVNLSNAPLPPEECERVASTFITQIQPLLDLLIELLNTLNHYQKSPSSPNNDALIEKFRLLTKEMQ